jgi:hypothetical protein
MPHKSVQPRDAAWCKWWLLVHGLAGTSALILGPMQFSDRLRQRFERLDVLPLGIAVIDQKSFKDHRHEQEHESNGYEQQILGPKPGRQRPGNTI